MKFGDFNKDVCIVWKYDLTFICVTCNSIFYKISFKLLYIKYSICFTTLKLNINYIMYNYNVIYF